MHVSLVHHPDRAHGAELGPVLRLAQPLQVLAEEAISSCASVHDCLFQAEDTYNQWQKSGAWTQVQSLEILQSLENRNRSFDSISNQYRLIHNELEFQHRKKKNEKEYNSINSIALT